VEKKIKEMLKSGQKTYDYFVIATDVINTLYIIILYYVILYYITIY